MLAPFASHGRVSRLSLLLLVSWLAGAHAVASTPSAPTLCQSSGNCGSSRYNVGDVPFSFSWPADPQISSTATVTPATFQANNVNGRRLVLEPGHYGDVRVTGSDKEWVLRNGAEIRILYLDSVSRFRITSESTRGGRLGSVHGSRRGGFSDVTIDGLSWETFQSQGEWDRNNEIYGTRVAILNNDIRSSGYGLSSFTDAGYPSGGPTDLVIANNRIVSDNRLVSGTNGTSLFRLLNANRLVVVDNYMLKADGMGLGYRLHSDGGQGQGGQEVTASYSARNIIVAAGTMYAMAVIGPNGNDGNHGAPMNNVYYVDNTHYQPTGNGNFNDGEGSDLVSGLVLRGNVAYGGGAWPSSSNYPGWNISDNEVRAYRQPPGWSFN